MKYAPAIEQLIESAPVLELTFGTENQSALNALDSLNTDSFGVEIVNADMAACCISGLWLRHNFDDRSHTISQDIHSPEGSYWHGIMHRRESDYSNSKYWYRNAGQHPIFETLAQSIQENQSLAETSATFDFVVAGNFAASLFVDAVQAVAGKRDTAAAENLRRIAEIEWQLLFNYCYNAMQ